jgi:8-hydroxy-5-deazaflavin:NADPH oxidoreductase
MNIGIIGAGNVGLTAAKLFARAGYKVALSNSRGPETLAETVRALGPNVTAMTAEDAAAFGDVVLEAIPFGRYRDLPVDALAGKIVISASNYDPERDGPIDFGGLTQSEFLARHLGRSRVVKGFNTIFWEHLRDQGNHSEPLINRRTILIAGDDPEAKRVVTELVETIGFTAVDMGTLAHSGRLETGLHGRPHRL